MNRQTLPLVVAALAMVAAGCSIPTDDSARLIDDAPEGVLASTTTTVEVIPEDETEFLVRLFFYNDQNQLLMVERPTEEQPLLDDVLASLVGNTPQEQEQYPGINSKLLSESPLVVANIDDEAGILTLLDTASLYRGFETDNPARIQRVFSQVVCTMLENRKDLVGVRIIDDEGDLRVQSTLDGSVIEGPVNRMAVNDCKTAEQLAAEAAAAEGEGEGGEGAEGEEGEGSTGGG